MAWPNNTRLFTTDLGSKARPAGGGLVTYDLPRVGILAGIQLIISGTLGGTLTSPNALGMASIINRIKLTVNSGIALWDVSGAGYHYLVRDHLEHNIDVVSQSNARSAISAAAFDLAMWLPVAINSRDPMGLVNLQNEQTALQLQINWEADANVASAPTFTNPIVQPFLQLLTVPISREDWPDFSYLQTFSEESQAVSGAGQVTFNWPRSNIYLGMYHGLGIGAAGSDNFTNAQLRVNQSQYLEPNMTPAYLDKTFSRYRGRTRPAGLIDFDLLASSGLGNYAASRDAIDTSQLTDIATIANASGAGTLFSVKRQLVNILPG